MTCVCGHVEDEHDHGTEDWPRDACQCDAYEWDGEAEQ